MAERPPRDARLDQPQEQRRAAIRLPKIDTEAFGVASERFARWMGTAAFLIYMTIFVVVYVAWNVLAPEGSRFDPYSFTFLTLVLSLQASYAAPLILLAQNRQDDRDRVALEQDRARDERNLADTEYLTREVASLRIAMRDLATRDFVRSELRDLFEELDERDSRRQTQRVDATEPASAKKDAETKAKKKRRKAKEKAREKSRDRRANELAGTGEAASVPAGHPEPARTADPAESAHPATATPTADASDGETSAAPTPTVNGGATAASVSVGAADPSGVPATADTSASAAASVSAASVTPSGPAPDARAEAVLAALTAGLRDALGEELLGLTLYGSHVTGGFDDSGSDLDVLALLAHEPTDETMARLAQVHDGIAEKHPAWADRIDVDYVTADTVRDVVDEDEDAVHEMARISPGEPLHRFPATRHYLFNWGMARRHGEVLYGEHPALLLPPITDEELTDVVRDHVAAWPRWVSEMTTSGALAYAVLTICRAVTFLEDGRQLPKPDAGRAVAERHPQYADLVHWAVEHSHDTDPAPVPDERRDAVSTFVRSMAEDLLAED